MRKCYIFFLLFSVFSCGSGKQQAPEQVSNIIDLTSAHYNPREVRLSELVDSITFVALETTPQSNIDVGQGFRFSGDYIFSYDMFFDGNGKYLGTVGTVGRGPLETLWGALSAIYADGYFWFMGQKLLQFDLTGKATGKVRELNSPMDRTGAFLNNVAFADTGDNFISYNFPDSVFFINRDFQITGSRRVIPETDDKDFRFNNPVDKFVSDYNGRTVFYNVMNDTIFHVSGTRFDPRWVVSLSEELRPDLEFFWESTPLYNKAVMSNSFEGSEYDRRSKGKYLPSSTYETDEYLFFSMESMETKVDFKLREVTKPEPYIAYFVKRTGETVRVAGRGFVDDILGLDFFYPRWGVYREKMVSSIWPYELHDLIAERRRTGTPIDPRLETLAASVKTGDNPILIIAHLIND